MKLHLSNKSKFLHASFRQQDLCGTLFGYKENLNQY